MIDNDISCSPEVDEEYLKLQRKQKEHRALRGRCISTGLLSIICLLVFSVLAIILSEIINTVFEGTQMLTDDKLSLISDMFLNALVSLIGFGVVALIFSKVTKTDLYEILPSKNISFKRLCGVVAIGFTVCISANFIANLFSIDLSVFGLETKYADMETGSTSILEHITYIVTVSLVPAITEEFVYRGCIMGRLRKYGDGFALFTSALLFGLMHGNFTQVPFAFVVGLATGWAVIYTGSIFPAMIIHGLNNFSAVIADIAYENFEIAGIETMYVDFVYMTLYAFVVILAFISVYKFAKNDKNFAKLEPYTGELTFKERIRIFFTTVPIIIFIVMTLSECLMTLKVID